MIINKEVAKKIYNDVLMMKKTISKLPFEEGQFINWIHTVNIINGIPYRTRMLGTDLLSDFEIAEKFSELIKASRYLLAAGDNSYDFKSSVYKDYSDNLKLYDMEDAKQLDSITFNAISRAICSAKRVNEPTMKTVEELRNPALVSSVEDKLAQTVEVKEDKEGNVSYQYYCEPKDDKFVPVVLTIQKYVDSVYSIDCDDDIAKWWVQQFDSLS